MRHEWQSWVQETPDVAKYGALLLLDQWCLREASYCMRSLSLEGEAANLMSSIVNCQLRIVASIILLVVNCHSQVMTCSVLHCSILTAKRPVRAAWISHLRQMSHLFTLRGTVKQIIFYLKSYSSSVSNIASYNWPMFWMQIWWKHRSCERRPPSSDRD